MKNVHNVDKLIGAAKGGKKCRIMTDVFIAVAKDHDGAVVGSMDGEFIAKVEDSLEAGVGRAIAPLSKDMPLLSINRVDACLLDSSLATVIITIEDYLTEVLDLKGDRAPPAEIIARPGHNIRGPRRKNNEKRRPWFPASFGAN